MKSLKRHLSVGFSWAAALGALALGLCSSACIAEQAEDDVEMVASPDDAYSPSDWPIDTGNGNNWISNSDLVNIMKANGPAFTSIPTDTPDPVLAASIQGPEILAYDFMINTPVGQEVTYGGLTWTSQGLCAMSYPPTIELRKSRVDILMLLTNPNEASVPVTLADNVCLISNGNSTLFVDPSVPFGSGTAPVSSIRQSSNSDVRFELAIHNRTTINVDASGTATISGPFFDVWASFSTLATHNIHKPEDFIRRRLCGDNIASCVGTNITLYNSDLTTSACSVNKSGLQILSPGVLCTRPGLVGYVDTTVSFVDTDYLADLWQ